MFYVVDTDFFLAFSAGFTTQAEAEAELELVKEWARKEQWKHDFIVTQVVEDFKPLKTIDELL